MFDYVMVGAGFAGSILAERIANILNKKVLIIEKRNHTGGNCYDEKDKNGIMVHKYGPHLFHTNEKSVFDYLSNFTDWHPYVHKVLAFIDGKKVPIPVNLNTLYMFFPETFARKLEEKLINTFGFNSKIPILELKKSTDKDLQMLADYVYEKLFLHYTLKQWGMKPEEMNPAVSGRVPIVINRENNYFTDKYQAVPEEGYTKIFERMLHHPHIKLLLHTDFKEFIKIDTENSKIYFSGKEFNGKLIFTGMIDELFDYQLGTLPYRSLDLQFETVEKDYFQEVAVVNYPNDYDFTRITEFKHIHPVETGKTVILKEYPQDYQWGKNLPFYPILKEKNLELYHRYLELAKKFKNLILVGRLADYQYYDMDDIIKKSLEIFEEKVK
ncbi:MAG TPA: UDP-galactopyranose mutase [Paludibacteraceae bacterium]|nr:UDP-galactopyranose mutase [Paludibacteraceae bacterium]